MGDCRHALGCRNDGCAPRWGNGNEQKWASFTSNYREDLCEPQPRGPPSAPPSAPPPVHMWCEQYHAVSTALNGSQPANTITSLFGLGLGAYGLHAHAHLPWSSYFHATCCLSALTGLGSAVHHWAPRVPYSHAMDWVPMLLLTACCATHTAHVLARVLLAARPRAGVRIRGLALFLGLSYATACMLDFASGGAARLQLLLTGVGGVALGHAVLLAATLCEALLRGRAQAAPLHRPQLAGARRVARAYLAIAAIAGVGLAAQRLEYPCPAWMRRPPLVVNLHALWHVAVFHAVYSAATLLLYLETRLDAAHATLASPCVRAPWLLLRVALAVPGTVAAAENATRAQPACACPRSTALTLDAEAAQPPSPTGTAGVASVGATSKVESDG